MGERSEGVDVIALNETREPGAESKAHPSGGDHGSQNSAGISLGTSSGGENNTMESMPSTDSTPTTSSQTESSGEEKGEPDPSGEQDSSASSSSGSSSDSSSGSGEITEMPKAKPCAVDFLFVVDNSSSMVEEQQMLSRALPGFIQGLGQGLKNFRDYHIGVTTSDAYRFGTRTCAGVSGALVTQTSGVDSSDQVCIPYANAKNFMSDKDDLNKSFSCAARPGSTGSGAEKPIDTMLAALHMETEGRLSCNDGFLRKDALLVVVLLSNQDDSRPLFGFSGSEGEPSDWYRKLLAIKGGQRDKIVMLGLVGKAQPNACPLFDGTAHAKRLISFIEMFDQRGLIGDVCDKDYAPFFKQAVSVIGSACGTSSQD